MIRNLKVLIVLAAVFALTAVAAGAAPAAEFRSTSAPSIFVGTNEGSHVMKSGETSIVCKTAKFSATQKALDGSTMTVHPEYADCEFLGGSAPMVTTGCNYVLSANGPVHIACSGTNTIQMNWPGVCTLSWGTQSAAGGATFFNVGSGSTEQIRASLNIATTFTKSGPLCFLVPGTTSTWTGTVLMSGFRDEGGKEGARVGISVS
jgi:hypothetical protein